MAIAETGRVNRTILERFQRLIARDRLAHAYLLTGPQGSGKAATALAIAQMVNCESSTASPCQQCVSCRKIASGNHPDIAVVNQGEDASIKIHKIRDVIQRIQMHPYEGRRKVIVIEEIDLLTMEGANAFLKTLEEPTASSLLLLTTANPERVPATVRSRCHSVVFFGVSRRDTARLLQQESDCPPDEAMMVAGFAEGCYGKARRLYEEKFIARRDEALRRFVIDGSADEAYLKGLAANRSTLIETLNILLVCFKDMMLLKARAHEESVTNCDRMDDLKRRMACYSRQQLRDAAEEIVNTKRLVDANLNIKVPLILLKEKLWISN